MIFLILGVALWIGAHAFRRIAPGARARMGARGRGPIALAILASVVLMVIGYRMAEGPVWWGRSPALVGVNNLLVLVAFYLFAASGMKTPLARRLRHPQLIGFSLWAVAHLLVNGDLASFLLFGGLLAWALWEIAVDANPSPHVADPPPAARKDAMALAGGVVVFAIVALIHGWIGPWPFGG
jgi:uncharacterized membrane protein